MQSLTIDHVGYLVKNVNKAITKFEALGFCMDSDVINDADRDITIVFLQKDGYRIELVSPLSDQSVVYNLIKKMGNTPYHFCYQCDDIEDTIRDLGQYGFVCFNLPAKAIAFNNRKVCFLMNPSIGMIELVER